MSLLFQQPGSIAVTPFKFTRRSKAQLGVDFLALVETNRFKYWQEEHKFDDAWWYVAQAKHCTYALDPGRPLETHLQWYVPATTKITTATEPLHDDLLVSAALQTPLSLFWPKNYKNNNCASTTAIELPILTLNNIDIFSEFIIILLPVPAF